MRAALFSEVGSPVQIVDDVVLDAPRRGEVRVRVVACGVCHSDVSLINGTFPSMGPTIAGHEAAGVVVELGEGVTELAVGDHVVLTPNAACGHCAYCVKGLHSVCASAMSIATSVLPDGTSRLSRGGEIVYHGLGVAAWADEIVVHANGAIRIDDDVPLDVACVIGCAVQTGVGAAINTADIEPGDAVLVLGAGGIGISIVQGAAVAGASRIIVSDPSESRREQALRFGATHVIDPTVDDVVATTMELTGIGADVAFEAVGSAALVEVGINAVRNGGTTVLVGAAGVEDTVDFSPVMAMFTEKKLVGSLLGLCWAPRDIPRLVALWQAGRLDLDGMVTSRRPLEEINDAIADLEAGRGLRTVLMVGEV
jgi:S-(hydroxymethyl)glutathione dehydrogenase / alcohol dehydrogenase